ncbi:MAG: homoserine kinase [Caldithrix sp.]|nr:MAG: homoserine kinase [Caldithrix sp.]
MVKVRVPASTSNLGAGFDTFGLALQLYLTVEMAVAKDFQIEVVGTETGGIATDESNLIHLAAQEIYLKAGIPIPPLHIKLKNDIPLSRGLGSSGAATTAGLVCANQLAGQKLSEPEILSLANQFEGHPENAAAALFGGLTVNCVDGNDIISEKIAVDKDLQTVLLIPEITISTDEARTVLPKTVQHADAVHNVQRSALLCHAFLTRDYRNLRQAMQDRLHQPFRKQLIPGYDNFEKTAYENGALGVCISGSGSTILCFTLGDGTDLRDSLQERAQQLNLQAATIVAGIENEGVRFIAPPKLGSV